MRDYDKFKVHDLDTGETYVVRPNLENVRPEHRSAVEAAMYDVYATVSMGTTIVEFIPARKGVGHEKN